MLTPQFLLPLASGLVIDLFAGGGGASTGLEQAIGRHVDVAINHDADAIGLHEINHPQTRHYRADVWEVCPLMVTRGQPVDWLHASPDCTDHSQAKGGQPRKRAIRSLAWVVHRWAGKTRPALVSIENVEPMVRWSNLVAKRDKSTGRVVTLDIVVDPTTGKKTYRVADPGERVPRHNQYLVADEKRVGTQWRRFIQGLRDMGYAVQWRVICNADLGAHSTRTRLYLIARRDGLPIVWPEQTHAKKPTGKLKAHLPASDCIDWSIPGNSIFGRERPLADATMRRVAYGMDRFVLQSASPFIINMAHGGKLEAIHQPISTIATEKGGCRALVTPTLEKLSHQAAFITKFNTGSTGVDLREPLPTVTAGGHPVRPGTGTTIGLVSGVLIQLGHGQGSGDTARRSHGANSITGPLGTVTASGGGHGLASAFMVQANGGFNAVPARDLKSAMSTVTTSGSQQQLIAAHMVQMGYGERQGQAPRALDLNASLGTVVAGGIKHAVVYYELSQAQSEGAMQCAQFVLQYRKDAPDWESLSDNERLTLVTIWIGGEAWVIVDITLRMLVPRELYRAQDFPDNYVIDRTAAGKQLTKTAQVRMAGNSVSPLPMRLLVEANYNSVDILPHLSLRPPLAREGGGFLRCYA